MIFEVSKEMHPFSFAVRPKHLFTKDGKLSSSSSSSSTNVSPTDTPAYVRLGLGDDDSGCKKQKGNDSNRDSSSDSSDSNSSADNSDDEGQTGLAKLALAVSTPSSSSGGMVKVDFLQAEIKDGTNSDSESMIR